MLGKTHRRASTTLAYIAILVFYEIGIYSSLSLASYYFSIMIFLAIAKEGAKFPDYDQNWNAVPEKTTFSYIVSNFIAKTGGKHRSKHTHSWDLTLLLTVLPLVVLWSFTSVEVPERMLYLLDKPVGLTVGQLINFSAVDYVVSYIFFGGYGIGWISHLLCDMFNGEGVYPSVFSKKKIAFVPKRIGKFRFNTGGGWERFVYSFSNKVNMVLGVVCMVYPAKDWLIAQGKFVIAYILGMVNTI